MQVEGLRCAACGMRLKQALLRLPGVTGCEVEFESGRTRAVGKELGEQSIRDTVEAMGVTMGVTTEEVTTEVMDTTAARKLLLTDMVTVEATVAVMEDTVATTADTDIERLSQRRQWRASVHAPFFPNLIFLLDLFSSSEVLMCLRCL